MLQREQLRRVASTYADEVAELRSFLVSADVVTCRADSLARIAALLASNHAFQRDLLSHIYLIRNGGNRPMRYEDLLGTLALAAAGPAFAAAARAQDAHDLLRFLMSGSTTLENSPERAEPFSGSPAGEHRLRQQAARSNGSERVGAPSWRATRHQLATSWARKGRKRKAVVIASLAAVAAVGSVVWRPVHSPFAWFSGPPSSEAAGMPGRAEGNAAPETRVSEVSRPGPFGTRPALPAAARQQASPPALIAPNRTVRSAAAQTFAADVHPVSKLQEDHAGAASVSSSGAAATVIAPGRIPAAPPGRIPATRGAIPTAILSQRLGSRALPADYGAGDSSYNSQYPTLLRRRSLLPLAAESSGEPELVASNNLPTVFRDGSRSPGSSAATIVRPVSLGSMAGNIIYSPAPAYPPAAAAAHVQGEVRVQAEVDRDGNVASARVISGPPLLRDAAVDAVQRWRYRPYLSAGRPVAMSATAVVDFQLQ